MLATSKHVFKIKTCRNLFKNYDLLSAVSACYKIVVTLILSRSFQTEKRNNDNNNNNKNQTLKNPQKKKYDKPRNFRKIKRTLSQMDSSTC